VREREPRQRVFVRARMRRGNDWSDVSIQNVSSRGLMARADTPPRPGAYIEIRKAAVVIVARAVWVKGHTFGVRTQDRLDIDGLLQSAAAQLKQAAGRSVATQERRDPKRIESDLAARAERSRAMSGWLQFVVFTGALGFAAWFLTGALSDAFAAPLDLVRKALKGG
jgi:hypothetical protein